VCDSTEAGGGISQFSSGHQFKSVSSEYPGNITMLLPLLNQIGGVYFRIPHLDFSFIVSLYLLPLILLT